MQTAAATIIFLGIITVGIMAGGFSQDVIKTLTLEEKIGQLLMVHFCGQSANPDAKVLIQEVKVGGIIYYNWANGLTSVDQVKTLSSSLQEIAKTTKAAIPLLIAVDQEGGIVSRLKPDLNDRSTKKQFTTFPGNRAIAETKDPLLAKECAFAIGQELCEAGVTLNLAPVVDVNCNPHNPSIGLRAFGSTPETVITFGREALKGYKQAGILSTLKHFPGHGDVTVDSHYDLPKINKSLKELEETELAPFARLAKDTDAIMTAHLLVPALDQEKCSTLSEKTISYLRNTIGFSGCLITDSLAMQGVLQQTGSVSEAAIQALLAGCDIILLGGKQLNSGKQTVELSVLDVQHIHRELVQAVKTGRIQEERVDEAVQRILKMKSQVPVHQVSLSEELFLQNKSLAKKIAGKALLLDKKLFDKKMDRKIAYEECVCIAPKQFSEILSASPFAKASKICYFETLNPTETEIERIKTECACAKTLIVFSYNAWRNPLQKTLIEALSEKPFVLIATGSQETGSQEDVVLFSQSIHSCITLCTTFSPTLPSLEAVAELLELK